MHELEDPHPPEETASAHAYVETLERLGTLLYSETSLRDHLQHVLELTASAVSGSAAASVTVLDERGDYVTAAASTRAAHVIDTAQYELHEGPCIDSLETGREHLVRDLEDDDRWPRFLRQVEGLGLRSVLSLPLQARTDTIGALNVFAAEPGGLDASDLAMARQIAVPAAVTVANGAAYRRVEQLTEQLQGALDHRTVIEQAKGVLAARRGCPPAAAFEVLAERARADGRRIVDVADEVVRTGGASHDDGT